MLPRFLLASALAFLFSLAVSTSPEPALAAEGARVILVLDASGSMWSRVGEETKIEAARGTVATILKDWRQEDQLGLVVYGHRRKGECSDIELLRPVGPVDRDEIMAQVGAISPKGKTPMTDAVRLAAETLKSGEGKSTVILVSDGIETCEADPCAVARSLKEADVGLVVHTVGFDISDQAASRQLSCIAKATGGLALSATDAKDLTKAIQTAVLEARDEQPASAPEAAPAEPVQADPPPAWNLAGSVRLAPGDDPIAGGEGIAWEFHRPAPEGTTPEFVGASYDPQIKQLLEPGSYVVTTSVGAAKVRTPVEIAPGRMNRLDITLDAGRLGLRAKRTETQTEQGDVFWEVSDKGGATIFNSYKPVAATVIPAGSYTVQLTLGAAKLKRDVDIVPGETTAVEIIAGVGRLQGNITFSPGGPPVRSPFTEIFAGAEPVENETSLAFSYEAAPKLDLPAGPYRARVKVDGVDRSFPFEVRIGERAEVAMPLDAGLAAFEAPGAESVTILSEGTDIYGDAKDDIATLYNVPMQYVLPIGTYKAVAKKGDRKVEASFEVKPGQRTMTRMVLE
jgi:Ca-activated chloride channel homolog